MATSIVPQLTRRDILVFKNPLVYLHLANTKRNTAANSVRVTTIRLWEGFTLEELDKAHSRFLDMPVPPLTATAWWRGVKEDGLTDPITVAGDKDINKIIHWNNMQMQCTLPGSSLKFDVPMMTGALTMPGQFQFNHAISTEISPFHHFVVGIVRPCCKWDVEKFHIRNQMGSRNKEAYYPLVSLANVCRLAGTRYGYIQNEKHMALFRFTREDSNANTLAFSAEYTLVPRSASGPETLTTGLALWWMCVSAMEEAGHE